jgi:phage tail-like protein
MAVARDRPYGAFRFRVTVARRELDCVSVVLPRMTVRGDEQRPDTDHLVLRRGYSGSLDLYEWWQRERQPKRSRGRRVTVDLLDDDGRPVTTWRFDGCRPVALEYTPLAATESAIVHETITLTVDTIEIL